MASLSDSQLHVELNKPGIHNYLCNRCLCVVINETKSEARQIRAGVPQGSVLSPILYVLFAPEVEDDDLVNIMFADDQLVLATGQVREAEQRLDCLANEIFDYCYSWKIHINGGKSKLDKGFGIFR